VPRVRAALSRDDGRTGMATGRASVI